MEETLLSSVVGGSREVVLDVCCLLEEGPSSPSAPPGVNHDGYFMIASIDTYFQL